MITSSLAACGDDAGDPGISDIMIAAAQADAAIISDPVTGPLVDGAAADREVAYVSLPPETVPGGEVATVTVRRTGARIVAAMVDGGFDPIPIPAAEGDTVTIEVRVEGSASPGWVALEVPHRRPPKVVRTRPKHLKRDVVLNAVIEVVFSEPVDSGTVTRESVVLRHGGTDVPSDLVVSPDGLTVELRPHEPLAPNSDYRLTVGPGVRDREGEALEAENATDFTTAGGLAGADLVYQSGADIWVMNRNGYAQKFVAPNGASTEWSPDGTRFAFHDDDIWVINTDGTGRKRLVGWPSSELHPTWSPDGATIAFNSDRGGDDEIYVMNADGTAITQLTFNDSNDHAPDFSPDGSRIVFYGDDGIWVMNADGTGRQQLTVGGDWEPVWSPDGNRIAFVSNRDGDAEVYVMNADGSGITQLTFNAANEGEPSWSADGQWIAYSSDLDGDLEIFRMNADGSGRRQLTFNRFNDGGPSWRW